ncbi:MAG: hypothetical protein K0S70_4677 [Microbacterium sp.]|nr:hypothetical protein [Microbacterium sp.]
MIGPRGSFSGTFPEAWTESPPAPRDPRPPSANRVKPRIECLRSPASTETVSRMLTFLSPPEEMSCEEIPQVVREKYVPQKGDIFICYALKRIPHSRVRMAFGANACTSIPEAKAFAGAVIGSIATASGCPG